MSEQMNEMTSEQRELALKMAEKMADITIEHVNWLLSLGSKSVRVEMDSAEFPNTCRFDNREKCGRYALIDTRKDVFTLMRRAIDTGLMPPALIVYPVENPDEGAITVRLPTTI